MPHYFSGTYSRANGYFGIEQPPPGFTDELYVEWATLSINGVTVDDFFDTPENPGLIDVELGVIFDSTNFGDDTNVTIEMRAMDSADRLYEVQDFAPVKNRAIAWGHPFGGGGEDGADEAHSGFLASNISSSVNIGAWMFVLSGAYQLMTYRNLARIEKIRNGAGRAGARVLSNQTLAVAAARAVVQRLGFVPSSLFVGGYKQHLDEPSANINVRGRAFIQLEHRPGGYSALGISGCSVTLDTQDGTVVTLVRYFSWRLGPPHKKITEQAAIALARQSLAAHQPQIDGTVVETHLKYVRPNDDLGSSFGAFCKRERIARLGYVIVFDRYAVLIDAQRGECIGGLPYPPG